MQTVSGIMLDIKPASALAAAAAKAFNGAAIQSVLNVFLLLNLLQFAGTASLLRLDQSRRRAATSSIPYQPLATSDDPDADDGAPGNEETLVLSPMSPVSPAARVVVLHPDLNLTEGERARGRVFAGLAGATVAFTWVLFMCSAAWKLRSRR